jgi:hypothetical protein
MTQDVVNGIIVGATGGAVAGLLLWIVGRLNEYELQWRDGRRVYKWLDKVTKPKGVKPWRNTRAIASYNNLTEHRVRFICSHHKKIDLSTKEKEMWSIKGRGRDEDNTGIVKECNLTRQINPDN